MATETVTAGSPEGCRSRRCGTVLLAAEVTVNEPVAHDSARSGFYKAILQGKKGAAVHNCGLVPGCGREGLTKVPRGWPLLLIRCGRHCNALHAFCARPLCFTKTKAQLTTSSRLAQKAVRKAEPSCNMSQPLKSKHLLAGKLCLVTGGSRCCTLLTPPADMGLGAGLTCCWCVWCRGIGRAIAEAYAEQVHM